MITRRELLIALGASALAAPFTSLAQQPSKVWRIGFMGVGTASNMESRVAALKAGLRDFGYVEGDNLVIEYRWAEGQNARFPALAAELVRSNVDLIVTHGTPGTLAAKSATKTIPIVMAVGGDPVGEGLVSSLSHPGGNITGRTIFYADISLKRFELLRDLNPRASQMGILLLSLDNQASFALVEKLAPTAKLLKIGIHQFRVQGPADFEGAFAMMAKQHMGAVVIPEIVALNINATALANLALKNRLLSAGNKEFAEAGGTIGFGPDIPELFRQSASLIDRIFKGANPGDLPIEQATKFEIILNRKTANSLGIKIPELLLQRATKVIE